MFWVTRQKSEEAPRRPTVLGPKHGEAVWFLDNLVTIKASNETGSPFGVAVTHVPAGSRTPLHRHEDEDEAFYVLEGSVTVFLGDEPPRTVGPGTFVHMPAGVPHALRAETEMRALLVCGAKGFLDVVREVGTPAPTRELPPAGPPDVEALQAATARHGVALLGPPPG